jgi:hypothetical protein
MSMNVQKDWWARMISGGAAMQRYMFTEKKNMSAECR